MYSGSKKKLRTGFRIWLFTISKFWDYYKEGMVLDCRRIHNIRKSEVNCDENKEKRQRKIRKNFMYWCTQMKLFSSMQAKCIKILMSIDHFSRNKKCLKSKFWSAHYPSSIKQQSTTCQKIFFSIFSQCTKTNQTTFFFNDVFNHQCVVLSLKAFFFFFFFVRTPNEHAFYY